MVRAEGLDSVGARVEGWLPQVSERGSGDDITMAVLSRGVAPDEMVLHPEADPGDEAVESIPEAALDPSPDRDRFSESENGDEGRTS